MRVEQSYPLTMGQLSMWRDLGVRQSWQLWESNLKVVWSVPPGFTVDQVRNAVVALAARHESLRTIYRPAEDPYQVRQVVLPDPEVRFVEALERAPFDLAEWPPWRASVCSEGGVLKVHLVIHHIAADGVALQVLESDFQGLLHGDRLAPAPTPGALAERQRGDRFRARLAAAAEYVTRTVNTTPPETAVPRGPLARACAHTGIPYATARRAAQELRVTLPNLLLTAYARTLATTSNTANHLLWLLAANRLEPATRRLVSSMTQWVPVPVTCPPGSPFETVAREINIAALTAIQHGVYDPFAVPPLDFDRGAFFTFVPPPENASAVPSPMEPPVVERLAPRGYSGASFYLIAHVYPQVRLTLRVMRAGYGHEQVSHFLNTMTHLLRQVVKETGVLETA